MKRFVFLIAAAGLFVSAAVSDAVPPRWRAYDDGYYGWGYVGPWGTTYYGNGPNYSSTSPYYYSDGSYSSGPVYSNGMYNSAPFYTTSTGPWASADWYKNSTTTSRGAADAAQGGIVQAGNKEVTPQPAPQGGLRIDDVVPGGAAKKADLRRGDVIIGVGTTRTQSFEELQKALAANSGNLEIVFLNPESRKMEKASVTPVDGKIGVMVVPVMLR